MEDPKQPSITKNYVTVMSAIESYVNYLENALDRIFATSSIFIY